MRMEIRQIKIISSLRSLETQARRMIRRQTDKNSLSMTMVMKG